MITTEDGSTHSLPTEVREHSTTKTSIYKAGELVYDGATGEGVGRSALDGPGQSLNEMLKWSIEHSDPAELQRRAAEGAAPPSRIDKEIMDMLLGQPTVAKMRECLAKLETEALCADGGLDDGCAALEELEYYAEDLDNALDLVKIGGLAALRRSCALGLLTDENQNPAEASAVAASPEEAAALREASCGVLAAMVQNNPKVAHAAKKVGIPQLLLAMLSGGGSGEEAERVGGVTVVRKALLALSALLRTADAPPEEPQGGERTLAAAAAETDAAAAEDNTDSVATLTMALPSICALASHADLKVKRRAVFLLASLAAEKPTAMPAIASAAGEPLIAALLSNLCEEDEDIRNPSGRLLTTLAEGLEVSQPGRLNGITERAGFVGRLKEAGGVDACAAALAKQAAAEPGSVDPEETGRIKRLAALLG